MEHKEYNENYEEDFIPYDENLDIDNSKLAPVIHEEPKSAQQVNKYKPVARRIETESNLIGIHTSSPTINEMSKINTDINGWNSAASKTISNWYNVFREYSYVYQYILDTNQKMASRLNMISTVSSSTLGIFSAFKLWMNDEQTFRTTSDIILMMFNFGIAILTTASKRYLDDARNEKIRIYIEEVDKFIGEISAQLLKMPQYRMNATDFLKKHNDTFTKLITNQPNITVEELTKGKKLYKKYVSEKSKFTPCKDIVIDIKI